MKQVVPFGGVVTECTWANGPLNDNSGQAGKRTLAIRYFGSMSDV